MKNEALVTVCGWCGPKPVYVEGRPMESTGICPECVAKMRAGRPVRVEAKQ